MTAGSVVSALGALGFVLALIWAGQAVMRRRGRTGGAGRRLHLAESLALDAKRRLHLISCDGRWLLLQTGGPQDQVIGWLPGENPP